MSKGRYFTFSLFLLILLLLAANRTSLSYIEKDYLWIEAESAERIEFPVEVVENENCSNNKCIVIREGAGVGFRGAGGEAVYPIDIKSDGEYVIWGRVFWKDGCGNSFYLGIDEYHFNDIGDNIYNYVLGHQSTYGKWMWVKGNKFHLTKGRHTLKVKNREDGVKLDKLLLTNDHEVIPQGFDRLSFSISYLAGKEFIKKGQNYKYKDFYSEIKYSVNSTNQKDFSFLFSYIDADNYKAVHFFNDKLKIDSIENGGIKNYCQTFLPKLEGRQELVITLYYLNNQLSVAINDRDIAFVDSLPSKEGFVGLRVNEESSKISNFRCLPIGPIYTEHDFYDDVWHFTGNPLDWQIISGNWQGEKRDGFVYCNEGKEQKQAIMVTGKSWWRNYQYTAYVKDKRKSGFGLLFYFKDKSNFYLFKCEEKGTGCKFVLTKRTEGKDTILTEKDYPDLNFNRWHKVIVKVFNGNIQTYIDDENIFDVNDKTINSGKIGLYGNNQGVIKFDDIYVESIYGKDDFLIQKEDYSPILYVNDLFDFYMEGLKYKKDRILDETSRDLFVEKLTPSVRNINPLKNWYSSAGEWEIKENKLYCKSASGVSQLWCKRNLFGDITIELDFIFNDPETEDLAIMLYQDEDRISNSIRISSEKVEFLENLKPVSSVDISLDTSVDIKHHLVVELKKNKLICFLNNNKIIENELGKTPITVRPSFWTKSGDVYIDNVEIYTYPRREYDFAVFSKAVEDFIEWEEETPYWEISFANFYKGLRGIIRTEDKNKGSVIWNRNKYQSGNIALEIKSKFIKGSKDSQAEQDAYKTGIIICSKGNIDSGYRVLFSNDNIILYRDGIEVSRAFLKSVNEGKWQGYKIQKIDKVIKIYITDFFGYDRLGLEYIDEDPIKEGKVGIQVIGPQNTNFFVNSIYIY